MKYLLILLALNLYATEQDDCLVRNQWAYCNCVINTGIAYCEYDDGEGSIENVHLEVDANEQLFIESGE